MGHLGDKNVLLPQREKNQFIPIPAHVKFSNGQCCDVRPPKRSRDEGVLVGETLERDYSRKEFF